MSTPQMSWSGAAYTGRALDNRLAARPVVVGAAVGLWQRSGCSPAYTVALPDARWEAYGSVALTPGRSAKRAFASKVRTVRSVWTACAGADQYRVSVKREQRAGLASAGMSVMGLILAAVAVMFVLILVIGQSPERHQHQQHDVVM
jgi:hypothetical protein